MADVDAERKRRKARADADLLGHHLVEGDRIPKSSVGRVRRGGEEADFRRVAAVDVGVTDAAEDGEVVPIVPQMAQIGRKGIAIARFP